MLVCNVSLRPRRIGIAANIAEAAAAADASTTGNIVFATLVDDPAAVDDHVDAYLGEIMVEAAGADAVVTIASIYSAAIDEGTSVHDFASSPFVYVLFVDEAATANDLVTGTTAGAPVTTMGIVGPLIMFDPTFPSSSLTIIDAGK